MKDKATQKPKPKQNPEGSTTKGPTQRIIRRVHAVVEVPVKVEEEDEDELVRTPINDSKGRAPPEKDPRPPTAAKKTIKSAELPRAKSKSWEVYRDDDVTPPASAPIPRRRKSGIDRDYYEPDGDTYNRRNQESADVRKRPPSRRKSIRELRESDFEYREEDEEESDGDELNLVVRFSLSDHFC